MRQQLQLPRHAFFVLLGTTLSRTIYLVPDVSSVNPLGPSHESRS